MIFRFRLWQYAGVTTGDIQDYIMAIFKGGFRYSGVSDGHI